MSRKIVFTAVIAAVYIVLTLINPISFGMIQFRVSEIIAVLPFWDRRYILGCILGVGIANFFSPLGFIDVFIGLIIAFVAYFIIIEIKNIYLKIVLYAIVCGFFVAFELYFVAGLPFLLSFASVGASQLIIGGIAIPVNNKIVRTLKKYEENFGRHEKK